jgi:hypothetical protein
MCVAPLQVLQMIPESSHVGLITFGTHVHVHELGYAECSKAFVFRGSKEYSSSQVGRVTPFLQQSGCAWGQGCSLVCMVC